VRKSWIIKTQLFAFYLFFFKRGGDWFGEKHVRNQKSEIKHQVLGPCHFATCLGFLPEKKKRQEGCGGVVVLGHYVRIKCNSAADEYKI
jgi:hypothetical protein